MHRRFTIYLAISLGLLLSGRAQNYAMHIDTMSACPGDTVSFGLWMHDFSNIGAITLFIRYDSSALQYIGHSDVHPAFPGVLSNGMTHPAIQVGISWSASIGGANGGTARLMNLNFIHKGGGDSLWFGPFCEVADYSATVLAVTYSSGMLLHPLPPIILQPLDDTVAVTQTGMTFSCEANGPVTYQWYSLDTNDVAYALSNSQTWVNGADTKDLQLSWGSVYSLGLMISGTRFSCLISGCGDQWTDTVTATVYNDVGIMPSEQEDQFDVWPVPAIERLEVRIDPLYTGAGQLSLWTPDGRLLLDTQTRGNEFVIDCSGLSPGIYILSYLPESAAKVMLTKKISITQR